MSTDSEIIARSLTRPDGFAEVFDRHHRAVHRFVAARAGTQVADDVLAETFLIAFEKRADFRGDSTALSWLFGIATNVLASQRRREARAWRGIAADWACAVVVDLIDRAADRLDAEASVVRLTRALRNLNAADRDTLLLYALGDLDYEASRERSVCRWARCAHDSIVRAAHCGSR